MRTIIAKKQNMNHNQPFDFVPGKVITLSTHLEKPSPFYFGYGIHQSFLSELEKYSFDKIFFFTEPHLFESYGKELYEQISAKYPCSVKFVPAGEKCKYFPVLEETCEKLIAKGASKKSILHNTTKAAIIGMVRSLATAVGKDHIRVNAVAPGWIMTERQINQWVTPEAKHKNLHEQQLIPIELTPDELVGTYLFLASDTSRAITRQTLVVDGGYAQS